MASENAITRGSGNVFADIGVADADEALFKAQLAIVLRKAIEEKGLTQSAAATLIDVAQPDLSKLLRGSLRGFSLERLLECLRVLGNDIEVKVTRSRPMASASCLSRWRRSLLGRAINRDRRTDHCSKGVIPTHDDRRRSLVRLSARIKKPPPIGEIAAPAIARRKRLTGD